MFAGARVIIADRDTTFDGFRLLQRLEEVGATAMQATPATWRLLLEAGFKAKGGFKMLCGGEALPRELANRLLDGSGELWNLYGPTETTIWSACERVSSGEDPITVGRPIANTQFYVLDRNDQLLPAGAFGQLHIGGDGVARGYYQREALTSEKFIANPFAEGRVYRTGDLARWQANGRMQILGRIDNQIKLRGFRIELGEIESVLVEKAGFAAAAVMLREDIPGVQRLVGYVVDAKRQSRNMGELRLLLAEQMPEFMIPTAWVELDKLPISPNGKLDRGALPAPDSAAIPAQEKYVAPVTPIETTLEAIFAEVLHMPRISTAADLLLLGTDSIQLFQITARANRAGLAITTKQLLQHRTVAALAAYLEASGKDGGTGADAPALPSLRLVSAPPHRHEREWLMAGDPDIDIAAAPVINLSRRRSTRAPVRGNCTQKSERTFLLQGAGALLASRPPATGNRRFNVAVRWRLEGHISTTLLERAWRRIIERHEILRTVFPEINGEATQRVLPRVPFKLAEIDLSKLDEEMLGVLEGDRIGMIEAREPFDLETGPLIRITLLRYSPSVGVILITSHQVVCDGWSIGVMAREMGLLYDILQSGRDTQTRWTADTVR